MIPFAINPDYRPDRLTDVKDDKYHLQFARYCSVALNNQAALEYFWRIYRNRMFYLGQQWDKVRDVAFLEDSNGDAKGRLPTVDNIIRPFVNQMINEATDMSLSFKAIPEGDRVINRREKELNRLKAGRVLADRYPTLTRNIKQVQPIGKDMEETDEIFRNVWTDNVAKNINNLSKYVIDEYKIDTMLRSIQAESLAVNGAAIFFNECWNGELVPRTIDPENFFYDNGATLFDLSDAEYMGHTDYALPTDLYEKFLLDKDTKKRIEKFTKLTPIGFPVNMPVPYAYTNLPGRIPVIYVEWRDTETMEFGYVIDQFGYEMFTRVYPNKYKSRNGERVYHENELIMPQSEMRRQYMQGKLKRTIDEEVLHYCRFTPSEIYTGGKNTDIVYDFGVVPYQDRNARNPSFVDFSYRCTTWGYHDGWISAPIDDVIDPQRLVNRYRSMAANKAEKDTAGIVIDEWSLMGTNQNKSDVQRKAERGETISVNSKGMGVPNAVSEYGARLAAAAQSMTAMANEQVQIAQQRMGILSIPGKESKKALLGQEAEEQSLHGLYLSRMVSLYESEYNCIANKGKRIYADNPRRLAIMVGDKGAEEIRITKDMSLEDFRIRIKRTDDEKQSKILANQELKNLLQMQQITREDFADNYDRITLDEVGRVIRDSIIRTKTAEKLMRQQQEEDKQRATMLMEAQQEKAELQKKIDQGIALNENEKDRMAKADAIILRTEGKIRIDDNKHKNEMQKLSADK